MFLKANYDFLNKNNITKKGMFIILTWTKGPSRPHR